MTMRACIVCGDVCEGARCNAHQLPASRPSHRVGYDHAWRKLSLRARRLQDWCSDCGAREDLTCDHSAEAWNAKTNGQPITLDMIDVVCRSCNDKRGPVRVGGRGNHSGYPSPPSGEVSLSDGGSE